MSSLALDVDEHLGFVHNGGQWRMFAGYLAEWILDYASYDPGYTPQEWEGLFRDGLLTVASEDGDRFCDALRTRELYAPAASDAFKRDPRLRRRIHFLVDFDRGLFLSSFYDIALEDYVSEGWTPRFEDPIEGVPDEVRRRFGLAS